MSVRGPGEHSAKTFIRHRKRIEPHCKWSLSKCKVCITLPSDMSAVVSCRPRFSRPLFLWALAGLITELAVQYFVGATRPDPLRFLMLLPLVPEAFFIGALVRAILKMDELERRITLESIAIAFILTLALMFV